MNIAQKFLLKHYKLSMKLKAFTPLLVSDLRMQFLDKHQNKQCDIHVVIKRIEEYVPKPIELPEFDLTKKSDHIYCVEWGMKKAIRNEFNIYQKMLKELKDKYVL
jgi:hypothetical protein